jgi:small conductance mechanosensitive channel
MLRIALLFIGMIGAAAFAQEQPAAADDADVTVEVELPPLPDAAELPDDVDSAELGIAIRPLSAEELQGVADAWVGRLREQVTQISRARLAARQLTGDAADLVRAEVAVLELERDRLADRVEIVLDELVAKGGDPATQADYVGAVTQADLDPSDVSLLVEKLQAWAVDPDGGIAVALSLIWFVVVLVVAFVLAKILRRLVRRALNRVSRASTLLKDFLAGLVSKATLLVGFILGLSFLGLNIGPLVAAIGAAGLVVGLALQGTLSNFASGILILMYRPYDVGDVINAAGGVSGKVEAMTLVSTTILTFDNQRIVVPNNNVWGETITNLTALPTRRVDLTFGVGYGDDLDRAMAVLDELCQAHSLILGEPEPTIKVIEHGDSSVNLICRPWTKTADYWTVFFDLQKQVKERFDAGGISIPFPQRDVHVHQSA